MIESVPGKSTLAEMEAELQGVKRQIEERGRALQSGEEHTPPEPSKDHRFKERNGRLN